VLLLVGGGAGCLMIYARGLNDNLSRTDAFSQLGERPDKPVEGSLNVLLLGSDSRDPDGADGGPYRADTIMLLHLPAGEDEAYFISIPRDLWVMIPPTPDGSAGGREAKINAATAFGGVPLMVQTVEAYTGVRLDHVVLVDFGGFVEVTDALGGVEMEIEQTITSIHPPRRTFPEGRNLLNGEEALDYIRQRYQFPDGDFTRMRNQQQFLRALMDKAVSSGTLSDPGKLNAFLQTVTQTLTVDEDFSLLGVGWRLRNLRSDNLHFMTSPHNGAGQVGSESVVLSDDAGAAQLYQAIREGRMAQWAAEHLDDEGG
jgi:LCP family protein required for cell wall assembly